MTADPSPHEKALEAAMDVVRKYSDTLTGMDVVMREAIQAYLTARVPDDVAGVVKELRAADKDVEGTERVFWTRGNLLVRAADLLTLQSERIRGLEAEVERLKGVVTVGFIGKAK